MVTAKVPGPAADQDLLLRVSHYLEERKFPALRNVQIEAHDGVVVLRGRVRTFYEKQLCQSCCRRVAGVTRLVDEVTVAE